MSENLQKPAGLFSFIPVVPFLSLNNAATGAHAAPAAGSVFSRVKKQPAAIGTFFYPVQSV